MALRSPASSDEESELAEKLDAEVSKIYIERIARSSLITSVATGSLTLEEGELLWISADGLANSVESSVGNSSKAASSDEWVQGIVYREGGHREEGLVPLRYLGPAGPHRFYVRLFRKDTTESFGLGLNKNPRLHIIGVARKSIGEKGT